MKYTGKKVFEKMVEKDSLEVVGKGIFTEYVNLKECTIKGKALFEKSAIIDTLTTKGKLEFTTLKTGNANLSGKIIGSSIEGDCIIIKGAVMISKLQSKTFSFIITGDSKIDQITAQKVIVEPDSLENNMEFKIMLKDIFMQYLGGNKNKDKTEDVCIPILKVKSIEADYVNIKNVEVDYVICKELIQGENCEIKNISYK